MNIKTTAIGILVMLIIAALWIGKDLRRAAPESVSAYSESQN